MAEDNEIDLYARLLAVQAGVIALIRALPKNEALPGLVAHESERVKALLEARTVPDSALEAFRIQVESIQTAADRWHLPNN